MEYLLLMIPVVFLVGSVVVAIRAVHRGAKKQKAVAVQMISFFLSLWRVYVPRWSLLRQIQTPHRLQQQRRPALMG